MMDKFTLVIGNKNYSSWSLRPWLLLKQFEIPFEEILIPLFEPGFKEKILEHSPAGKVPILKHGKISVWDSLAIAEYVNEVFPEKNLWPKDSKKRALARSISAEMHSGFTALRSNCPMDARAKKKPKANPPELSADIKRVQTIWEDCRKANQKDGPFLFGQFSVADCMYAPVAFRFQTYGIKTSGEAGKYLQTMLELPAMQEWSQAGKQEPWVIAHH